MLLLNTKLVSCECFVCIIVLCMFVCMYVDSDSESEENWFDGITWHEDECT